MNDIDTMPHTKGPSVPAVSKATSVPYLSSLTVGPAGAFIFCCCTPESRKLPDVFSVCLGCCKFHKLGGFRASIYFSLFWSLESKILVLSWTGSGQSSRQPAAPHIFTCWEG